MNLIYRLLVVVTLGNFMISYAQYEYVTVGNCSGGIVQIITRNKAGMIYFNLPTEASSSIKCSVTFTVAEGERIVIQIKTSTMALERDDTRRCSRVYLALSDPNVDDSDQRMSVVELAPRITICNYGEEEGELELKPFYSVGNSVRLQIESEPNMAGPIVLTVQFTSFKDKLSADCFGCLDTWDTADFPVCIDKVLLCDRNENCPNGSDENYKYTKENGCDFYCDGYSLDDAKVCDGTEDCASGHDESEELCPQQAALDAPAAAPFSNMSMFDIVFSIIIAIATVFLFIICVACCCRKPKPRKLERINVVAMARPVREPGLKKPEEKITAPRNNQYGASTSV
ncbi:uncharacterized protein [Ptychodera flava]|uniref:uncharacterized protein n=1 Tax=Ptychodera flava TaxID=63121 RepID=UPI00396A775E